jgi:hypothetical protein
MFFGIMTKKKSKGGVNEISMDRTGRSNTTLEFMTKNNK